jgi:hypothetical protein
MEFYKIYKSCIINRKINKCNTNKIYIKEILNNDDKKTDENNKNCSVFKTNLGTVFKTNLDTVFK